MDADLRAYVPRLGLTWAEEAGAARTRVLDGTLAFADVSGFTRLSERLARLGRVGAEHTKAAVNAVFEPMVARVLDGGGDVVAFAGDALLLWFDGDDHARQAAAALVDLQRIIGEAGAIDTPKGRVRLRLSAGVHRGEVLAVVAGRHHRALFLAGPTVTRTAALEKQAVAGEVLASDELASALPRGWWRAVDGGVSLDRRTVRSAPSGPRPAPSGVDAGAAAALIPPALRTALAGPPIGEHRPVAMAFVSLPGTDRALAAEGEAGVVERIDVVVAALDDAVDELGICWLETDVGSDEVRFVLTAGAPELGERDEERMLLAVRAVADAGRAAGLGLRIGANRGPVFLADVGHARRRTFNVMGDAMNTAARLMGKADADEPLVSQALLDRSSARFASRALPPFTVRNRRQAVHAAHLGPRLADPVPPGDELPLIGRDEELAVLAAAVAGGLPAVEVVGEAGAGKSRLLAEARRAAEAGGQVVVAVPGDPFGASTPYGPWRVALRRLLGVALDASPEAAGVALRAAVQRRLPAALPWAPLLARAAGGELAATPEVERIDPEFLGARLALAVEELLAGLLGSSRVLVVAEDQHWFDDASTELLAHLAVAARGRRWSVVTSRRPGGDGLGVEGSTVLELGPLDAGAADRLAAAVAGDAGVPPDVLARIRVQAAGNPLFLRELAASAMAGEDLPDRVEQVLGARIGALAPADRSLLRDASVLGATADLAVVADALDDPAAADPDRWQPLAGFVEVAAGTLRFHHDLLRITAYEGLPYRRRRALHGRVADVLSQRPATPAAVLAHHHHAAGRAADAWRWSLAAATEASGAGAWVEAADSYQRALEVAAEAGAGAPDAARVAESLGDVARRIGRTEVAAGAYRRAGQLACGPVDRARLLAKRARLDEGEGRYSLGLRRCTTALGVLRAVDGGEPGAASVTAEVQLAAATCRYYQGRFVDAAALAEQALVDAAAAGDVRAEAQGHLLLEMVCSEGRMPGRAAHGAAALERFEALGDDLGLGNLLVNLGVSAYNESDWVGALASYDRAVAAYRRAGDVIGEASTVNNRAEILTDQGRDAEAAAALAEARRVFAAARYPLGVAATTSGRARLAVRAGAFADAHRLLDEAEVAFASLGSSVLAVDTQLRRVETLVAEGRHDDALAAVPGVAQRLADLGEVAILPVTLRRLEGQALLGLGRLDEGRAAVVAALEAARAEGIPFEEARCLRALGDADAADARFAALGVVTAPIP